MTSYLYVTTATTAAVSQFYTAIKTTVTIHPTLIFITKYNEATFSDLFGINTTLFHSSYLQTFNPVILLTSFVFTTYSKHDNYSFITALSALCPQKNSHRIFIYDS